VDAQWMRMKRESNGANLGMLDIRIGAAQDGSATITRAVSSGDPCASAEGPRRRNFRAKQQHFAGL